MKPSFLIFIFCLVFSFTGQAQKAPIAYKAKNRPAYSLQQQFSSLKYRSSSVLKYNQPHKVVRMTALDGFFKNVQDTLRAREQSIKNAGKETAVKLEKTQQQLAAQQRLVSSLQKENAKKDEQLALGAHEKSHLSVLGLDMDKQVYVGLSLSLLLAMGIVTGIFVFMYKKCNQTAQEKINAFEEVSQELKDHKIIARDRETKLKRELQSEANKIEELNQEIARLKKQAFL